MDTGSASDGRPQPEVTLQQITLALIDHPAVAEASVVPYHHPQRGNEVVAFVVPRGDPPPETELHNHVQQRLGRPGPLNRIVFLKELPRSATGKVDRRRLEAGEFMR